MKTCKNCTTRYTSKFNYCPYCGAKWVDYRLTPRKITHEFSDKYLGTDNVFLKTCLTLLRCPEDVINGYITGQRKKYVNVINFYFISLTLFGLHIFILKNFYPELLGLGQLTANEKGISETLNWFYDYMGVFTTFFLPLYALAGWIVFYKRKYNFTEHIVLYGYVFGLINILTFLSTPLLIIASITYAALSIVLSIIAMLLTAWYYKRIFHLSIWKTMGRTVLGVIIYSILQIITMIILSIIFLVIISLVSPELLESFKINLNGTQL